jgi:hypothetical protein
MKRNALILSILLLSAMTTEKCFADINIVHATGVGARAYGLANNFVALSNDQSGLFWNPAGLAFVPQREFQIAIDGLSQRDNAKYVGQSGTSVVQHLRLVNIGYLHSFPASQGGFTIAGALQNPFTFDDVLHYSGTSDNGTVFARRDLKDYGGLSYWTGGFGLQVAEGLGLGGALSFVTGSEEGHNVYYRDTNGVLNNADFNSDYDTKVSRTYLGYDFRVGLLYKISKNLNAGMRFVFPQTVWFSEDASETYPNTPNEPDYSSNSTGKIFSSYSGALGVSGVFPFLTFSTEFRARAPYSFVYPTEMIPDSSLASQTILGAGLGLEIPVIKGTTLLRLGYSWDQYDTHPFARQYDDESGVNWGTNGVEPSGDKHLGTIGMAFIMKNACLEITYGYTYWKLKTWDYLTETHAQHRLLTSLSFRF